MDLPKCSLDLVENLSCTQRRSPDATGGFVLAKRGASERRRAGVDALGEARQRNINQLYTFQMIHAIDSKQK